MYCTLQGVTGYCSIMTVDYYRIDTVKTTLHLSLKSDIGSVWEIWVDFLLMLSRRESPSL